MCKNTNKCKENDYNTNLHSQEDLIKYKMWLEQELEIIKKTLQDIEENT